MSEQRVKLNFNSMGDLDNGGCRIAVNDVLKLIRQDLLDRPTLLTKRKMVLTLTMEPDTNPKQPSTDLEGVVIGWQVDPKIPTKGSMSTRATVQNDGEFAFSADMPDAGNDHTIFTEIERKEMERAQRLEASKKAQVQQLAEGEVENEEAE